MTASIATALISEGELPPLDPRAQIQVDKTSGGVKVLNDLIQEFSECFTKLNLITLVQIASNENNWSAGSFIITGDHTPSCKPFRNAGKVDKIVDFRIAANILAHSTGTNRNKLPKNAISNIVSEKTLNLIKSSSFSICIHFTNHSSLLE